MIMIIAGEPSKSIPELLSRHAHLFPRWLLPVFTSREAAAITTHFPGFSRISIEDLRKKEDPGHPAVHTGEAAE